MTIPYLTLQGVSYSLPDGRALFSNLSEQFDCRATGLVGPNGIGKTVLAKILAGAVPPSDGQRRCSGRVYYLAQQVSVNKSTSVAELAGVQQKLAALERIAAGSCDEQDFAKIGDDWDIRQRLVSILTSMGLGGLDPQASASQLSGGEAMSVALAGALLAEPDFLILDEPSNHLDRQRRAQLIEYLQNWSRGLIVISHDRELLNSMERIVELSSLGLSSYGGNYKFYAAAKAQAQQAAAAELARCKLERKREQRAAVEQRERQQRRNAQGNRKRKGANQATILLDAQQQRSQQSTAKLQQQQLQAKQALQRRERLAAEQLDQAQTIAIGGLATAGRVRKTVARLAQLRLPFGNADMSAIDLTISGNQRIAVSGPNGCGKSTLLKVLAGQLLPKAGSCEVQGTRAYLDQRLLGLKPELSVLAQLKAANPNCAEGELRTRLAQLGLGADKTGQPSGLLSGGERLKGYLACLLYAEKPPELLLLDEPSNHLDLASIQALEQMLQSYQGALVLVSHDRVFLESVGFSHYLEFEQQSWSLKCV